MLCNEKEHLEAYFGFLKKTVQPSREELFEKRFLHFQPLGFLVVSTDKAQIYSSPIPHEL